MTRSEPQSLLSLATTILHYARLSQAARRRARMFDRGAWQTEVMIRNFAVRAMGSDLAEYLATASEEELSEAVARAWVIFEWAKIDLDMKWGLR